MDILNTNLMDNENSNLLNVKYYEKHYGASGDSDYYVRENNTPSYSSSPVIIRDNIAGTKYNEGSIIKVNSSIPVPVTVVNSDGSDYRTELFFSTNRDGKDVFIKKTGLVRFGNIGSNTYRIITPDAYPFNTESWINTGSILTKLPLGYKITGSKVMLKTFNSDEQIGSPVLKEYVIAIVDGKQAYVPSENLTTNKRILSKPIEMSEANVVLELPKPTPSTLEEETTDETTTTEGRGDKPKKKTKTSKVSKAVDDKILGMPKNVAIGIGVSVALIGAFVIYKKFVAKS